jgi:hypothetical protein
MILVFIEGIDYELEFDPKDKFVKKDLQVAYQDDLARRFMPTIYDPRGFGSSPHPPEIIAYRLLLDSTLQKICIIYEVYWKRQECTWKELNKDHDHDYEQIQLQFNLISQTIDKIIISSVGPIENAGHGVEVFHTVSSVRVRTIPYITSSNRFFPWGGISGRGNSTQVREIPIEHLLFEDGKIPVVLLNCYHAFSGLKHTLSAEEKIVLAPKLVRLDGKLLEKWYYLNIANRFGHDLSNPFKEPYMLYFPPPGDWISQLAYEFLWFFSSIKRLLGF